MKLIVGIDPGITSAFCALDLKGTLVKAFSSKRMGLENLISELSEVGTPIVIACDVKIAPVIVVKIAAAFHAKLVTPPEDMRTGEKQVLSSKFELEDIHQKDACAAAVFAFNKYKLLFRKVDEVLREANKTEKAEEVKTKLILHKAKSIKDALVERPLPIMLQQKKRAKGLYPQSRENIVEGDLGIARKKIDELALENKKLKDKIEWLELVTKPKADVGKIAELRKITIENLEDNVKKVAAKLGETNEKLLRFKKMFRFYKENEIVFLTELEDLSSGEIQKLSDLDFGNCLLVKNLALPGKDSVARLKELKISNVFFVKRTINVSELKKQGFFVAPETDISIKKENGYVYVSKSELNKLIDSKKVEIEKLIEEHRERLF